MLKVGTVCMKIAGRDAGQLCVVVEEAKDGRVLVDGAVRRKAVNVKHLEPTGREVKVKAGASHAEVAKALDIEARSSKARKPADKPKSMPRKKEYAAEAPVKKAKPAKKTPAKKEEKKE